MKHEKRNATGSPFRHAGATTSTDTSGSNNALLDAKGNLPVPGIASSSVGTSKVAPKGNSVRFPVEPRDVPAAKAARRMHLTSAEFRAMLAELIERGFPTPDPTTDMFDLKAIDNWMDRRSGLTDDDTPRDAREVVNERLTRL